MDFRTEFVPVDKENGLYQVRMCPDPRRYDRIEYEGKPHYFDKYLRVLIPQDLILGEGARQLAGLPIYHLSPSNTSTPEYAEARKGALMIELQGGSYSPPPERALQHRSATSDLTSRELVFLSIDICGGSALRRLNGAKFDQAYKIFVRELGTIIGQFNGSIYKATGDGFIAYIDFPGFAARSDQAVDTGLSLLAVLHRSVNPCLRDTGLPELNIRIGADTGEVEFRQVVIPTTGFSDIEIASDALNRAVKIQESAEKNQFRIGRDLYELVHVQWLERAREVSFDGSAFGMPGYHVYEVT
jgi:class 3 adenylate cyclase